MLSHRFHTIIAITLSAIVFSSCGETHTEPSAPNVILIMTDDQGYGDFGVMGNPIIQTPNWDQLAAQSASMSNFYVSPVCSPTRASLMTGRYNYRTRVVDTWQGRSQMEPAEITIAEAMKEAGYATGIFGKWHLGDSYPMRPQDQGFDEVLVHRGGGIGQPTDPLDGQGQYTDPVLVHNGNLVYESGYCTDIYFERGMEWIEKQHQSGKNFFMYIATNAPHDPFHDVPEELYQIYKAMDLSDDRYPQENGHPINDGASRDNLARVFAMITNIDQNIGKLMNKLDEMGIADNTIVIFLNDNGPNSARFLRGHKGMKTQVYEGGIRSPFWMRWPDQLKSGVSSDRIAAHIDVMPTILDACNIDSPGDVKLDGRSLLPLLMESDTDWPERHIVIQSHRGDTPTLYNHFAIRNQRWKLVHNSGFGNHHTPDTLKLELYDLQHDPYEMKNVIDEEPAALTEIKQVYETWFKDVSETRIDNYAPPRIVLGNDAENPLTLFRNDWRSHDFYGHPETNGYWLTRIDSSGTYEVLIYCHELPTDGKAILQIKNTRAETPFQAGESTILFRDLHLEAGEATVHILLEMPEITYGPWQVQVLRTGP